VLIGAAALAAGVWLGTTREEPACTMLSGGNTIDIAASQIEPNSVRFFCYEDHGAEIRFLLARDPQGRVYSVVDACTQCYKYHKGYTFKDGFLVCRLCGNRYRLNNITTGEGSCVPIKLPSQNHNRTITVRVSDLKASRWLF
jgi:uncharacterized membrane protein